MPAPGKNTSVSLKPQKMSTYTMPIKRAETDEEKKKKYQQAVEQHNKDYYDFVDLYTGKKNAVDAGYGPRSTSPLGQAITTHQAAADTRNKWKSNWGKYEATTGNLMPANVHTAIGGDAYQDKLNEMLGKTGNQYKAGQAGDWLLENTARTFRSNNKGQGTALTGREETQARLAGYNTNNDLARYEMGTKGKRPELGDSGNYRRDAVDVAAWDQEARSYGGAFDKDAALQAGRTNALTAQDYRDLAAGYRKQNEDSEIGQLYAKADAIKAKEDAENNGGEWYTGTDQADKDWNDLLDGVARSYFGLKNYDVAWNTGKGEAVSGIATQMMTGDRSELEKRTTKEDYANRGANGIYYANDWWATKADNMAASLDATEALDQELRTLGGYGSQDAGKYNPTESGMELIDLINSKDARDRATKEKVGRTGEANWNLATDKELDVIDSVELMTPDEIDKANKWYNLAGSEGLQRYMDALQGQLWMRQTQAEEAQQQDEIRNGSLFENLGRFAVRAGVQAINSPQGWLNMAGALFGDEMANDPNSPAYRGQQFVANMDRGLAAKLDADFGGNGVGQFFYGVAASSVDSLLSSLIGSAAGPSLVENVSLAIMGSEAMSRSLYDGLKAGKSPNECVADALASGIIETLTEKIAWKDIFQGKGGLRAWAQATMEEGLEEGVGNVAGKVYDDLKSIVTGHETEIEEQVNEMLAKNPGMPINKVMNTILGKYVSELGNDILAGAASGAGMSGVMQIINGINNTSTGSRVMANGLNLDAGKVTINESALSDPANAILPNVMAQAAGLEAADDIVTKPARAPQGMINEASVQDNSDIRENAENIRENEGIIPENARELTPEEQARLEERSEGETAPAPVPEQKTKQATPPQRPKRPRSASIADNANVSRLLDLADGFGSDTEAGQTAAKIRDDIANGKRVSKARVGQLFSEVAAALPEQGQSTVIDTMTEGVQDRLNELGEDRATAAQISEVIGKIAAGMDVARSDMAALAASKYGMDVLNEFMVDENASDTVRDTKARAQEAAETNAQIQSEVSDMARKPDKKARTKAPAAPRGAITEAAKTDNSTGTKTTAAADQLTRKNTKAKPASRRVTFTQTEAGGATDGEITKITNVAKDGTVTVEVKDSEGKTRTIEADPSEIQMDGAGTAGIISEIQNSDRLFTAEEANGMLQTYDGGDAKAHVEAFDRAYRDGWNHPGETRNNKSSKTFEEIAYTLGQDDHKTVIGLRSQAATQAKNITNGKGSVTLETKGENAVKSFSNLRELVKKGSTSQSSAVQVLQKVADAVGAKIVLYESQTDSEGKYIGEGGYYNKDTGEIGIDLNAGQSGTRSITNHALLSVAGHELTHFIQDRGGENAYDTLLEMARTEVEKAGESWDEAVERKLTNRDGNKVSMDDAVSEVVANTMSDMLGNEERLRTFLESASQKNPSLFTKITDWLRNLADKIRSAFEGTQALSRETEAIREAGGYGKETVDMWYRLLEEAGQENRNRAPESAQSEARTAEETDGGNIQYSTREQMPGADLDVWDYLADDTQVTGRTEAEEKALTAFRDRVERYRDAAANVQALEQNLDTLTGDELKQARAELGRARSEATRLFNAVLQAEQTDAMQAVMRANRSTVNQIRQAAENGTLETLAERTENRYIMELARQRARFENRLQEQRHNAETRDNISRAKNRIARRVKRMDDLIRHETDYRNVPEDMKPLAEAVVGLVINSDKYGGRMVFDKKKAIELTQVYTRLLGTDGGVLTQAYDQDTLDTLNELTNAIDERGQLMAAQGLTTTQRLDYEESLIARIDEAVQGIYGLISRSREAFINGKAVAVEAAAQPMIDDLRARKNYGELQGVLGRSMAQMEKMLRLNNMTMPYFVRWARNAGLTQQAQNIFGAESDGGIKFGSAKAWAEATVEKYHYKDWGFSNDKLSMTTEDGRDISLTREQAMALYAVANRESMNGMNSHHLDQGGYVLPIESTEQAKIFGREKSEALEARTNPVRMGAKDMDVVRNWLTDEQKAYADEMVRFLSEEMSEYGNKTSMALFGIKKYKEKYYYPFQSYRGNLYQRSDAGSTSTTSDARLKHASFTKALTQNANTPLVLTDFTQTVMNHVQEMITYSSFVLPIESLNRVMNYQFDVNGQKRSVRTEFERKYGRRALGYIQDYIKDLNGGIKAENRAGLDKFVSLMKKGGVAASVSVALQQPWSIIRAGYVMSHADLLWAGGGGAGWALQGAKAFEEAKKYAGTAVIKDMGRFDTGVGYTATEWLTPKKATVMGTIDKLTGWAPEMMDKLTWGTMWRAVKHEQARLHKDMDPNSEAFLQMCGKRFDEVMRLTQVYDSTVVRSGLMRSKNTLDKMVSAFAAEPTITANMLMDAVTRHPKKIGNALAIFLMSQLGQAVIKGIMSTIRGKDDDEDKRYLTEKISGRVAMQMVDELNPFNLLPIVRDITSVINGEEIDRSDMSVITDIYKEAEKIAKTVSAGGVGQEGAAYKNWWQAFENGAGTLLKAAGIPLKNVMRDLRATKNLVTDVKDDAQNGLQGINWNNVRLGALDGSDTAWWTQWWDKSRKAYYTRITDALLSGEKDDAEMYNTYLTSIGVKPDTLKTGVKTEIKDRWMAKKITDKQAIDLLVKNEYSKSEKDAWTYLGKAADKALAEEEDRSASVYGSVLSSIHKGDWQAAEKEIKTLGSHDIDRDTVVTRIRTDTKDRFINGEITETQAVALLKRYSSNEKETDDDRYWKLRDWQDEKANGKDSDWSKYSDLDAALDSGDEDAILKAMQELADHGVKETTLKSALTKWKKMREDAGITINGAKLMAYNKARKSYFGRLYSKDKAGK